MTAPLAIFPAISLWQPWASLLFTARPTKVHETRHWRPPVRLVGRHVLIHAAKTKAGYRDMDEELQDLCMGVWGRSYNHILPLGAFIGTARLGAPFPMRDGIARFGAANDTDELCGNWCAGRWAWPLHERTALPAPVPAKGQQGWWDAELPDSAP